MAHPPAKPEHRYANYAGLHTKSRPRISPDFKHKQQRNGQASDPTSSNTSGSSTYGKSAPTTQWNQRGYEPHSWHQRHSEGQQRGIRRSEGAERERAARKQTRTEPEPQPQPERGLEQASKEAPLLKICFTNARSLPGKINELSVYATVAEPDIILICESWCNDKISNAFLNIPGYQLETDLRTDRKDTGNGIGGGLLVYSKLGVKILINDKFDKNAFNQFCAFTVKTESFPLHIVLAYRPPTSNTDNLIQLCDILRKLDGNSILIGDINLPNIDWASGGADARGRRLLDAIDDAGLVQLVNFATHDKGNLLDLVITNCSDKVLSVSDDGKLANSDHCILSIELTIPNKKKIKKRTPNWNKANYSELREYLWGINWRENLTGENVEEEWNFFKNSLAEAVERFVPKSTPRPADRPKWLNRELVKLIRKKKTAWRTSKAHPTTENIGKYKKIEKEVSNKVRNAKRNLEKKLAYSKDGNNTKTFANYIKSKTKSNVSIGPLKENGKVISDDKEMAGILNAFFSSVFSEEDQQNLPDQWQETEQVLSNILITESSILEKVKNLKEKSAPGPDGICTSLLRNAASALTLPLKLIFENSLRSGQVPNDWRHATVAPIFKKGTKGSAGNYRPVSLTSIPCKLLESIINDQITAHLSTHSLINDSQHGFTKGRSCTTNLTLFLDKLTEVLDRGKAADIFYLDFSKAFDKVPRQRLLQKLKAKGIDGDALRWIQNWLSNRTQAVRVGNEFSDSSEVKSGVPQGSVLGPVLFIIFIDDIDNCAEELDLIIKFADDMKGLHEVTDATDSSKLQLALNRMAEWADKWCMAFNVDKCKIMHVGKNNPGFLYFMNGTQLQVVEEEKDIGVLIHKSLKPSKHVEKIANMAGAVLAQLVKNFHFRDRHIFKRLYVQYVRPHLEFSSPAWNPWTERDIEVLEKIQRKAVGMISGLTPGTTYEQKCTELGLDTLKERRRKQDILQAFKILKGYDRVDPAKLFTKQGERIRATRQTANPENLVVPHTRLEIRRNSYFARVPDLWNNLDNNIKTAKTLQSFKNALKKP